MASTSSVRSYTDKYFEPFDLTVLANPKLVLPKTATRNRAGLIKALQWLDTVRESLGEALKTLADRRSSARIIITSVDKPQGFVDLPDDQIFEMRLAHLSWPETWRWIRRNLPALVSFGENYLARLWTHLGTRLDHWEELERRVLRAQSNALKQGEPTAQAGSLDLAQMVTSIAPPAQRLLATGTGRIGQRMNSIAPQ